MTSVVDICNMALSHIRAGSINAIDENSAKAQLCNLHYATVRDTVLSEPWSFNHSIRTLTLRADTIFNWKYLYQYPEDCLKINYLIPNWTQVSADNTGTRPRNYYDRGLVNLDFHRPKIEYEVFNVAGEDKVIASNDAELRLDYQAEVTDVNLMSPKVIMAISHLLAANIVIPIIGIDAGRSIRSDEYALYNQLITSAMADDLNQRHKEIPDDDMITIRSM